MRVGGRDVDTVVTEADVSVHSPRTGPQTDAQVPGGLFLYIGIADLEGKVAHMDELEAPVHIGNKRTHRLTPTLHVCPKTLLCPVHPLNSSFAPSRASTTRVDLRANRISRSPPGSFPSPAELRFPISPLRDGNGMVEELGRRGDFIPPRLEELEEVLAAGLAMGKGRVLADLWDVERMAVCPDCGPARRERLRQMNLAQRTLPPVPCDCARDPARSAR